MMTVYHKVSCGRSCVDQQAWRVAVPCPFATHWKAALHFVEAIFSTSVSCPPEADNWKQDFTHSVYVYHGHVCFICMPVCVCVCAHVCVCLCAHVCVSVCTCVCVKCTFGKAVSLSCWCAGVSFHILFKTSGAISKHIYTRGGGGGEPPSIIIFIADNEATIINSDK